MGYLTTVTIYNDGASELTEHPKKLAEILERACFGAQIDEGRNSDGQQIKKK